MDFTAIKNMIAMMKQNGLPTGALETQLTALEQLGAEKQVLKEEVFVMPRIRSSREEKFYNVAEKVLDKSFNAYGVVKERSAATREKGRNWLITLLMKIVKFISK